MKNKALRVMFIASFILTGCGKEKEAPEQSGSVTTSTNTHVQVGKIIKQQKDGKEALRYETFGNEGFWSDVVRLPKGILESKLTPAQALKMGLSINTDSIKEDDLRIMQEQLIKDGLKAPFLHNPSMTMHLLNANAFVGLVVRDVNNDGRKDLTSGDKLGVSCVLCHAVTDRSMFEMPGGGSIGKQIDGPAAHQLQMGKLFAVAANTKGFYPMAQIFRSGKSLGRAPGYSGLFTYYGEADYDSFFSNPKYYPAGTFDDTLDGIGNPVQHTPLFRQDLAAPFGSAGEAETFLQYANTKYTLTLDPSVLVTENGRAYLKKLMGQQGEKLAQDYLEILEEIGVRKYSYIKADQKGEPGSPDSMVGLAVDKEILEAIEVYVKKLRSPAGVVKDLASVEKGKMIFNESKNQCINCHNADQTVAVKNEIVAMKVIFPGDSATVIGKREPYTPMLNTSGRTYDDKMIMVNATLRGQPRGTALPLLMDLARKPKFLNDGSVESLEKLFDSSRGSKAPHPFYVSKDERADLKAYLESLDDNSK